MCCVHVLHTLYVLTPSLRCQAEKARSERVRSAKATPSKANKTEDTEDEEEEFDEFRKQRKRRSKIAECPVTKRLVPGMCMFQTCANLVRM